MTYSYEGLRKPQRDLPPPRNPDRLFGIGKLMGHTQTLNSVAVGRGERKILVQYSEKQKHGMPEWGTLVYGEGGVEAELIPSETVSGGSHWGYVYFSPRAPILRRRSSGYSN